ncbi:hypothetical protein [Marinobacterium sp. BA1]|uniref:hypothetical protein n=1 Tax=Marinobacterium sp. BA1 TaxID=3138931 RepID=UPI0032E71AD7
METKHFTLDDYAASAPAAMQDTIIARMEGALRVQMHVVPGNGIPPLPVERTLGLNGPRTLMVYGTHADMHSPLVSSACYRATGQSTPWSEAAYDRFQYLVVPDAWISEARQRAQIPLNQRSSDEVVGMGRVDLLIEYACQLQPSNREALLVEALRHPIFDGRHEAIRFELAVKTGTDIPGALEALVSSVQGADRGPTPDVAIMQLLVAHPNDSFVVRHVHQFLKDHEASLPPHMQYLPYEVFKAAGEQHPELIDCVVNPHQEQHANHMYRCHELVMECEWLSEAQVDHLLESVVNADPTMAEVLDEVGLGSGRPTELGTSGGRSSSMSMG